MPDVLFASDASVHVMPASDSSFQVMTKVPLASDFSFQVMTEVPLASDAFYQVISEGVLKKKILSSHANGSS